MALTKVTGGILSQPIDLGITTATTGFFSGIVTAQSVRVLGDLTVDGSTTTLDTVVTEVDRLEVAANNVTVGVAITQSGTGDILKLYDSSTPVFVVKDGGRVGIGTDNPTAELDIEGAAARIHLHDFDSNQSQIIQQGDSLYLNVDSEGNGGGTLRIRVGGNDATAEKLRITSTGNVGIGTNNPGSDLHVYDGIPEIRLQDSDGTDVFSKWKQVGGNARLQLRNEENNGSFTMQGLGGGTATDPFIKVESDGKVGIGTDNPQTTLEVVGSGVTVYNAAKNAAVEIGSGRIELSRTDSVSYIDFKSGSVEDFDCRIQQFGNGLRFYTGGQGNTDERLRIASDGEIGIGTDDPGALLNVYGTNSRIRLSKSDAAANIKHWDLAAQGGRLRLQAKNDADGGGGNLFDFYRVAEQINEFRGVGAGVTWFVVNNLNQKVGIGSAIPAQKLDVAGHIKVDSGPILENASSGDSLKITSPTGYLEVGSKNASYSHFYTDRGKYYFNKRIIVDEGLFGSYNEDLVLATNIEDERIRIKNNTGNVGIGTNNPGELLDVYKTSNDAQIKVRTTAAGAYFVADSSSAAGYYGLSLSSSGTEKWFLGSYNSANFQIKDGTRNAGTATFTIQDNTGNIGIGTDNPGTARLFAYKDGTNQKLQEWGGNLGSSSGKRTMQLYSPDTDSTSNYFTFATGNAFKFKVDTINALCVASDGEIGIGIDNPQYKLHVGGNVRTTGNLYVDNYLGVGTTNPAAPVHVRSDANAMLQLESTDRHSTMYLIDSIGSSYIQNDSGELRFGVDGGASAAGGETEAVRIDSDGFVGIGTVNPDHNLHVFSGSGDAVITIESTGNDKHSALEFMRTSSGGDSKGAGSIYVTGDTSGSAAKMKFGVAHNISHGTFPKMTIDGGTGKVGIGTENPVRVLHVEHTDCRIRLTEVGEPIDVELHNNGGNAVLTTNGASQLRLQTNNTERLVITDDGRIGINTDNPGTGVELDVHGFLQVRDETGKLSMQMDGANGNFKVFQSPPGWSNLTYNPMPILAWDYKLGPGDLFYIGSGGNTAVGTQMALVISDEHGFKVGRSGYDGSDFDVSSTAEWFRITKGGIVGIGTNAPQTKLHIRQDTDNNTDGFRISRTNSAASYSQYIDTSARFNIGYSNPSTADPSPQITLDQDGKVGIGTNSPASLLHVDGDVTIKDASPAIFFSDDSGVPQSPDYRIQVNSGEFVINDDTNSATRLIIDSSGNIGIGTDDPASELHVFAATGDCVLTLEADRGNSSSTENDNPYIVFKQDGSVSNSAIGMNPNSISSESNSLVIVNGAGSGGILFKTGEGGNYTSGTSQRLKIHPDGDVSIYNDARISGICTANTGFMFGTDGQHYLYQSASDTISLRITSDGPYAQFKDNSGDVQMGSSSGDLRLSAGGNEKVRIKSSGGAALFGGLTGQTTDTSKLAVQGGDSNIGVIQVHAGGGENDEDLAGITFSHGNSNTTARAKGAIAFECDGTGYGRGDLCFYVDGTADNNQVSAADERVRIMNNGAIAIGTDNAVRGPVHVHQKSNGDVQIHLSNEETGATSSGRGFTIFGGAGTSGRDMGFVNRETTGAIEFYTNQNGTLAQRGGWHTGIATSNSITTFCINTASNGTHSNFIVSNHDITDYNGIANRSEYPIITDIHFTGSDAVSDGNKTKAAWRHDVENTINNNTSNVSGSRLQVYGIYSTLNSTRYSYIQYGAYLFANSSPDNSPRTQTVIGVYGYAQGYAASSSPDKSMNIYGGHFIGYRGGNTSGGHAFGIMGKAQQITNGSNKTGDLTGVYGEAECDDGPVNNAYAFRAHIDVDDETADGNEKAEITNAYLYYGSYAIENTVGAAVTNKRGIYLYHCTNSYIQGDLEITGNITAPNNKSFRIPHPLVGLTTTKDLVHTAIEGPQVDLIYRGKTTLVAGTSTINLDTKSGMTEGTFVALNRDVQCFTTNETGWTNVKGSVTGNQLTITAQENTCTDTISWMVIGERQDNSIKSAALTDADGKLILEPDQEIDDNVKYQPECEKNIYNEDPNIDPNFEE